MFLKKKKDISGEVVTVDQTDLSLVASTVASLDVKKQQLAENEGETIRSIAKIEETFDVLRLHADQLCGKLLSLRQHMERIGHGMEGISSEQIVREISEEAEDLYTDAEKEKSYYDELYQGISELKNRIQQKNRVFEETDEMLAHLDEVLATMEHKIHGK